MSEKSLSLHTEHRALSDENALLREELAHLLTEEHDLVQTVRPNLLALFQKKIGAWEVRRLRAQVEAARARRRLELAQAAVNAGKLPDWTEIEGHLELEFLAWQQKLRDAMGELEAAEHRLKHLLPPAENRELKRLYYALVKKLHPDLNAELSEDQRRLWLRVQSAYECSDVEELRALALLADRAGPAAPTPAALATLRRDRETLSRQIAEMLRRIEQVESQPPFTLRKQLKDESWLAKQREEIEAGIAQFEAQRAALAKALEPFFKMSGDGKKFGSN